MRSRIPFTASSEKDIHCPDKLAFVKAAAWAWHAHSSASSSSRDAMISDHDAVRTRKESRPSRYKMEAQRMEVDEISSFPGTTPASNAVSTLLDSFEILTISKTIDTFIQSSGISFDEKLCVRTSLQRRDSSSSDNSSRLRSFKTKQELMKPLRGPWLRPGISCRGRDDVDTFAVIKHHRRPVIHTPKVATLSKV